jgi:hypothetical protein
MSIIPVDEPPGMNGADKPHGLWLRLAQAVDDYFVDRTKRAVPETTLRRCQHDIDRLRRMMHKNTFVPVDASVRRPISRSTGWIGANAQSGWLL